jgi:hypothetical protein
VIVRATDVCTDTRVGNSSVPRRVSGGETGVGELRTRPDNIHATAANDNPTAIHMDFDKVKRFIMTPSACGLSPEKKPASS